MWKWLAVVMVILALQGEFSICEIEKNVHIREVVKKLREIPEEMLDKLKLMLLEKLEQSTIKYLPNLENFRKPGEGKTVERKSHEEKINDFVHFLRSLKIK